MASAAPPKRMVSSFFITLASPHRATVTQQQPALQAHSAPASGKQHAARRLGSTDGASSLRQRREEQAQAQAAPSNHGGARARALEPQSPQSLSQPEAKGAKLQEDDRGAAELLPPPIPPPAAAAAVAPPSSLGTSFSEESALPPPPPAPPVETPLSCPLTPGLQTGYSREVETSTPSSGLRQDEQSHGIQENIREMSGESNEVCGFCRKPVALSEPAVEALNRTYHDSCFQCRSCNLPLAGKPYYNKAGIPLCEDCYQASLELCWACGEAITDHVIRALERAYHLSCFTCATCNLQIGEQPFAQGEVGEVYCLQDYYRKYAPKCHACNQLIIPKEDGTDSYNVECLGRSYHENCYRCEVCVIQLSPDPNEHGCYPLDGRMLCKSCHLSLVSGQH